MVDEQNHGLATQNKQQYRKKTSIRRPDSFGLTSLVIQKRIRKKKGLRTGIAKQERHPDEFGLQ